MWAACEVLGGAAPWAADHPADEGGVGPPGLLVPGSGPGQVGLVQGRGAGPPRRGLGPCPGPGLCAPAPPPGFREADWGQHPAWPPTGAPTAKGAQGPLPRGCPALGPLVQRQLQAQKPHHCWSWENSPGPGGLAGVRRVIFGVEGGAEPLSVEPSHSPPPRGSGAAPTQHSPPAEAQPVLGRCHLPSPPPWPPPPRPACNLWSPTFAPAVAEPHPTAWAGHAHFSAARPGTGPCPLQADANGATVGARPPGCADSASHDGATDDVT